MLVMSTVREQAESFLKAWDRYLVEVKTTFFANIFPPKKNLTDPPTKKFQSIRQVDKYFHSCVEPVVERFFGRNPSLRRGYGEPDDIEIYNRYADHCPYLLNPSYLGKQRPAPPRLHIPNPLEGWQDVLSLAERCFTKTKDMTTPLMMDLTNQWKDYQDLVLALARREDAIQAVSKTNGTVSRSEVSPPLRLKMVRNENMAYWRDQFLPLKGKHFDMLCKLAQNAGSTVMHQDLYGLINSQHHKDLLLRQYINDIRKAFPTPYSSPNHPDSVIKTRKMEGYYLDLSPEQVEII